MYTRMGESIVSSIRLTHSPFSMNSLQVRPRLMLTTTRLISTSLNISALPEDSSVYYPSSFLLFPVKTEKITRWKCLYFSSSESVQLHGSNSSLGWSRGRRSMWSCHPSGFHQLRTLRVRLLVLLLYFDFDTVSLCEQFQWIQCIPRLHVSDLSSQLRTRWSRILLWNHQSRLEFVHIHLSRTRHSSSRIFYRW